MSTYRDRRSQLHRAFLASALEKTEDNRHCRDMATDAMEHQHLETIQILLQPLPYLPDIQDRDFYFCSFIYPY